MAKLYPVIPVVLSQPIAKQLIKEYNKFYTGELLYPCDEECPSDCDGQHYYTLPTEYPQLFKK